MRARKRRRNLRMSTWSLGSKNSQRKIQKIKSQKERPILREKSKMIQKKT